MYWRPLVLVALALLAGCSALGTTGETPTVTPAPVPEPTETTATSPLPPGVTGNGITDIDALAAAHANATRGQSYTWRDRFVVIRPIKQRNTIRSVAHVQNESTYDYWTNRREAPRDSPFTYLGNLTEYAEPGERYVRVSDGPELRYMRADHKSAAERIGNKASSNVHRFLWVENAAVGVTRVDGQRYYEITGRNYAPPSQYEINNYTVTAVVSPDGFVRSLNASYIRQRGARREQIVYSFAYTAVGNTTVEKPDWVSERWHDDGSRITSTAGG